MSVCFTMSPLQYLWNRHLFYRLSVGFFFCPSVQSFYRTLRFLFAGEECIDQSLVRAYRNWRTVGVFCWRWICSRQCTKRPLRAKISFARPVLGQLVFALGIIFLARNQQHWAVRAIGENSNRSHLSMFVDGRNISQLHTQTWRDQSV